MSDFRARENIGCIAYNQTVRAMIKELENIRLPLLRQKQYLRKTANDIQFGIYGKYETKTGICDY